MIFSYKREKCSMKLPSLILQMQFIGCLVQRRVHGNFNYSFSMKSRLDPHL